jgi:hypothetical protein
MCQAIGPKNTNEVSESAQEIFERDQSSEPLDVQPFPVQRPVVRGCPCGRIPPTMMLVVEL